MADQYHHGNLKSKLLEEAVLEAQGHFQTENITLQMISAVHCMNISVKILRSTL